MYGNVDEGVYGLVGRVARDLDCRPAPNRTVLSLFLPMERGAGTKGGGVGDAVLAAAAAAAADVPAAAADVPAAAAADVPAAAAAAADVPAAAAAADVPAAVADVDGS